MVTNKIKYRRIELAMVSGAIPIVSYESRKLENKLRDVTSFEQESYYYIGRAIENLGGIQNVKSIRSLSRRLAAEVRNRHLARRKIETPLSVNQLMKKDNDEDSTGWEPVDVLANIENSLLLKEKADLLAKGDSRCMIIINSWISGFECESDLANLLAKELGGKKDSHRKFIQRFRTKCQTELATAV